MTRPWHRDPDGFERATRADLQERRWLRLHVLLLAALTTALCWGVSALLRRAGVESLAWRPLAAVLLTWPLYLGLLWAWGHWLVSERDDSLLDAVDGADALDGAARLAVDGSRAVARSLSRSPSPVPEGTLSDAGSDAVSGALDSLGALGDADEGAVVVVPLAVVVGVAVALATALGFAVFGLFGVDVLLGVAVEVAFASMGGALAWRARREGWLMHALRRTTAPMIGLALAVGVAGVLLAHWLPEARTLPEALRLLLGWAAQ
jgi:hypothetical protein